MINKTDLQLLTTARVGRFATIGTGGFPSVVPICFGVVDSPEPAIVTILDEKPKQVGDIQLGRIRNLERRPQVGLTIDHFEEDWSNLWYIQIRGDAVRVDSNDLQHPLIVDVLRRKYPQYLDMDLEHRIAIAIRDLRIKVWKASPDRFDGESDNPTAEHQPR